MRRLNSSVPSKRSKLTCHESIMEPSLVSSAIKIKCDLLSVKKKNTLEWSDEKKKKSWGRSPGPHQWLCTNTLQIFPVPLCWLIYRCWSSLYCCVVYAISLSAICCPHKIYSAILLWNNYSAPVCTYIVIHFFDLPCPQQAYSPKDDILPTPLHLPHFHAAVSQADSTVFSLA